MNCPIGNPSPFWNFFFSLGREWELRAAQMSIMLANKRGRNFSSAGTVQNRQGQQEQKRLIVQIEKNSIGQFDRMVRMFDWLENGQISTCANHEKLQLFLFVFAARHK